MYYLRAKLNNLGFKIIGYLFLTDQSKEAIESVRRRLDYRIMKTQE